MRIFASLLQAKVGNMCAKDRDIIYKSLAYYHTIVGYIENAEKFSLQCVS